MPISLHDAAYCAAAWASGETQKSLAETLGYKGSAPVCIAIGQFVDKYTRDIDLMDRYDGINLSAYGDERKGRALKALVRFKATL